MSFTLSIVLPAYNEEKNLARSLPLLCAYRAVPVHEIIVADDGSSDGTAKLVQEFAARDPRVRLVSLPRNRGKGAAIKAGLESATGSAILYTDADLIYRLDDIPRWLERLADCDVINGNRRLPDSVFHVPTALFPYVYRRARLGLWFNAGVRAILPVATTDTQSGFKLLRAEVAKRFAAHSVVDNFSFDVELFSLLSRWGYRVAELPVRLDYHNEISTVRLLRDGWRMARTIWGIRQRLRTMPISEQIPLLVTADDFGFSPAITEGILRAHTDGIVNATSIMANMPAAAEGAARLRGHSNLAVGVHLTATAGAPLTNAARLWLTNRHGQMSQRRLLWCWLRSPKRTSRVVREEWAAQIHAVQAWGLTPTHLDSHHHVHLWPGLQGVALHLAKEFGVARVRASRDRRFLRSVIRWPYFFAGQIFAWRARFGGLAVTDNFCGYRLFSADDKLHALRHTLNHLRSGTTELYCHPGEFDPHLPDSYRAGRLQELEALTAVEAKQMAS